MTPHGRHDGLDTTRLGYCNSDVIVDVGQIRKRRASLLLHPRRIHQPMHGRYDGLDAARLGYFDLVVIVVGGQVRQRRTSRLLNPHRPFVSSHGNYDGLDATNHGYCDLVAIIDGQVYQRPTRLLLHRCRIVILLHGRNDKMYPSSLDDLCPIVVGVSKTIPVRFGCHLRRRRIGKLPYHGRDARWDPAEGQSDPESQLE